MYANIMGALGIAANILIYQQKSGKKLLIFKLTSDCFWALHYIFLNAYAAAAIAAIGIIRETVFLNQKQNWAKGKIWLLIFVLLSIISAIFSWKGIFSILPAAASVISVFSFWRNSPKLARFLAFPISFSMLTYDIVIGSIMGITNEILTLTSSFYALVKYRK